MKLGQPERFKALSSSLPNWPTGPSAYLMGLKGDCV